MLKREIFWEAVEELKEFYDYSEKMKRELEVSELPKYDRIMDVMIRTLIEAMDDKETEENDYVSWIVLYCWEYNFGRSRKPLVINEKVVRFLTPDDLYNILTGEI